MFSTSNIQLSRQHKCQVGSEQWVERAEDVLNAKCQMKQNKIEKQKKLQREKEENEIN